MNTLTVELWNRKIKQEKERSKTDIFNFYGTSVPGCLVNIKPTPLTFRKAGSGGSLIA